jgi:hypothetical protein
MSFESEVRNFRRGDLSMLENHIMMSSLICRLVLILVLRLAHTLVLRLILFHVLCLICHMNLTIAHMVLVNERTALRLDALVMSRVLVVVIIFDIGLIFLLEGPTPTLSRDIWMIHVSVSWFTSYLTKW